MISSSTATLASPLAAGLSATVIQTELLAKDRLVLLKYAHTPTISEWTDAMVGVLADRDYRAGFGFLFDLRGNRPGPSRMLIASMLHFMDVHQVSFRGARMALLVNSPAAYRMARAGQDLATDLPLQLAVFHGRTPGTALRWLRGLPAATNAVPSLRLA